MLHPTFPFESERLIYRSYDESDKEWLFALRQDEDVMRYVPFGDESYEEMDEVLAKRMKLTGFEKPGDGIMCMTIEKETGARVGEVMLRYPTGHHETGEIGFIVHPDYQGKGFANEGTKEMLRLGFEGAGFHRIIGICDGANAASRAALKRLGMREEAYLRSAAYIKGAWCDEVICAILADEWRALQKK